MGLYADNARVPGSLLTTIGTVNDTQLLINPTEFPFTLSPSYPLATNHRYWIGLTNSTGMSIAAWSVASNDSGTGVSTEFWYASSMVHPNTDPPFQMQVTGSNNFAPTPAPSTFLLILVGVMAIAIYSNRKSLSSSGPMQ